ncbi:unnamed protein product, partial [Staurois parvus]
IARGGWRTLSGGQWRDWQRGVADTEWRSVAGLAERGVADTEWRSVEGLAGGWRTLSGGQWRDWQRGVAETERLVRMD